MLTPELITFVTKSLKDGKNKESISAELKQAGWQDSDIARAFETVMSQVPPTPTPVASVSQPAQSPIANTQTPQGTQTSNTQLNSSHSPTFITPEESHFSRKSPEQISASLGSAVSSTFNENIKIMPARRFPMWLIVIVILFLGAGGVYAAVHFDLVPQQIISSLNLFSKPPYTKDNLIENLVDRFRQIKIANHSFSFKIDSTERQPGDKPFDLTAMPKDFFTRDRDRLTYVSSALSAIQQYYYKNKVYPASLSQVKVPYSERRRLSINYDYSSDYEGSNYPKDQDPPEYVLQSTSYSPNTNRTGYNLKVSLESKSAVSAVTHDPYSSYSYSSGLYGNFSKPVPPTVNGDTVTFTEKNSTYLQTYGLFSFVDFVNGAQGQLASVLPFDISLSLTLSSVLDRSHEFTQGDSKLSFEGAFGGITYQFKGEHMIKDGDSYVNIEKVPAIPGLSAYFDPTVIQNKWIKISKEDFNNYGKMYGLDSLNKYVDDEAERQRVTKEIMQIAIEEKVLVVTSDPVKEEHNGKKSYRYDLEINPEGLSGFYSRAYDVVTNSSLYKKDSNSLYSGMTGFSMDPEDFTKLIESDSFKYWYDYEKTHNSITAWFDSVGNPISIVISNRLIPDEKVSPRLADRQFVIAFVYGVDDINKPVTISPPNQNISIDEAIRLITGKSLSEQKSKSDDAIFKSNLSSIRTSMELYYDAHNNYGTPVEVRDCPTGAKTHNSLSSDYVNKSLAALFEKSGNGYCAIGKNSYAIGFAMPSGGISSRTVACIDSTGFFQSNMQYDSPANVITKDTKGEYICRSK